MARNMQIEVDGDTLTITVNLNPKKFTQTQSGNDMIANCRFNDEEILDELPEGYAMNFVMTRKAAKARKVREVEAEEDAPVAKRNSKKPTKKTAKPGKVTKKSSKASADQEDGDDMVGAAMGSKRRRAAA